MISAEAQFLKVFKATVAANHSADSDRNGKVFYHELKASFQTWRKRCQSPSYFWKSIPHGFEDNCKGKSEPVTKKKNILCSYSMNKAFHAIRAQNISCTVYCEESGLQGQNVKHVGEQSKIYFLSDLCLDIISLRWTKLYLRIGVSYLCRASGNWIQASGKPCSDVAFFNDVPALLFR